KLSSRKRVIVLGNKQQCWQAISNFKNASNQKHKITKVALGNYYENVVNNIDEIDIIYLIDNCDMDVVNKLYYEANKHDKRIFLETNFQNLKSISPNVVNIDDESILELSN